jgi:glycosyltransferase involved in cell wall biosynthesis
VHLVALVTAADHVCCRYRLRAFRPTLLQAGHTLDLRPLPRGGLARWRLFRRLAGASVVLQRYLLPGWQLAILRRHVRHLVLDLDDAIFFRDSYAPGGIHDPVKLRRFAATARACDAVVAGNGFLAEHAAWHAADDRVHVIPTCVDPGLYRVDVPKDAPDGKTLVWVGSSSTLQGLEAAAQLLDALAGAGVRLKVICDRFPTFPNLPVIPCRWSEAGEARDIAGADVGISWVPDDPWSRGKCGLKVLQYLAAGLPVVANPVGVHAEMVRPGVTGFLATTADEWRDAVARLCGDAELRRRFGRAGRALVESRYSVAAGARAWLRVIERLEGRQSRAA